jgi:hypothetical protein
MHLREGEPRLELQGLCDGPGDMRGRLTGPTSPSIAAATTLVLARGLCTVVAGGSYPDHAAVVELLDGFLQGGLSVEKPMLILTNLTDGLPLL